MIGDYLRQWVTWWNRFWFQPRGGEVLSVMRVLVGSMLVYTHAVWTYDLAAFFAADGAAIPEEYRSLFSGGFGWAWSHFDWFDSSAWLWSSHVFALIVFTMFMVGLFTRVIGWLAFLLVVSYANRATGALFGLDQINAFLTLYLAMSHCGRHYSIDSWRLKRRGQGRGLGTFANNIATRLIQLHLCIVYLFAGLGKLQGTSWWNGEAVWGTIASYEYQTIDMTWMAGLMWLVAIMTYVTVAWEVSYAFLIWPSLTRPIFLLIAVVVHVGIGLSMGMMTFGLIMLYANLAFVEPRWLSKRRLELGQPDARI